ncbi:hypothetical protein DFH06DRAFT_1365074 [Mycena polygramma]|nr:hypothetical protein DFH06DRAFT_1365074 [Mycena polygramma]
MKNTDRALLTRATAMTSLSYTPLTGLFACDRGSDVRGAALESYEPARTGDAVGARLCQAREGHLCLFPPSSVFISFHFCFASLPFPSLTLVVLAAWSTQTRWASLSRDCGAAHVRGAVLVPVAMCSHLRRRCVGTVSVPGGAGCRTGWRAPCAAGNPGTVQTRGAEVQTRLAALDPLLLLSFACFLFFPCAPACPCPCSCPCCERKTDVRLADLGGGKAEEQLTRSLVVYARGWRLRGRTMRYRAFGFACRMYAHGASDSRSTRCGGGGRGCARISFLYTHTPAPSLLFTLRFLSCPCPSIAPFPILRFCARSAQRRAAGLAVPDEAGNRRRCKARVRCGACSEAENAVDL